jgi:hypothetical protein
MLLDMECAVLCGNSVLQPTAAIFSTENVWDNLHDPTLSVITFESVKPFSSEDFCLLGYNAV